MSSSPSKPSDPSTKPKVSPKSTATQGPESSGSMGTALVSSPPFTQPTKLPNESQIQSATVRYLRLKPFGRRIDIGQLQCQNRNEHHGESTSFVEHVEDRVILERLVKQGTSLKILGSNKVDNYETLL